MKWASQFVRVAALVANILFVGLSIIWILRILPWKDGPEAAVVLATVVAGYVSSNGGALIVTSRRGRIIWTILALLANFAFAYAAVCIVGEVAGNFIAAQAFYACIILVAVNSLGILSKGRLSPRRPQTVAELVTAGETKE
jgi:hypothetical protein